MIGEREVRTAARLYEVRDAMRRLHGERYDARVAEIRPYIEATMERDGVSEIVAATRVAQRVTGNGFAVALIVATAVEMVEGGGE